MKKIFMSMLALAALASCSSEEVLNEPVDNGERVPINLRAGVVQVETKGAIESIPSSGLDNVVFVKSDNTSAMDWTNATKYTASIASGGAVTFTAGTLYYPINKDEKSFLVGYYPESIGTHANGTVTIGDAQFTGQEDIMFATELSGSKGTPITGTAQFQHQLSQLKFTLTKGDGFDDTNKVKAITVKGTCKPTALDLKTGKLTYAATPAPLTITDNNGIAVSTDGTECTQTVLIQAVEASGSDLTITLDIELTDGTKIEDVAVSGITKPTASQSHNVTLTFKQKEIAANAEISKWTPSSVTGTGTVE